MPGLYHGVRFVHTLSAVKSKSVAGFICALPQPQREIAATLRAIIKTAAPDAEEAIKWGTPTYSQNGMLCCIMVCKAHVSLLFYKGTSLSDPKHLLEGTGKGCRHIKLRAPGDIKPREFTRLVKQAVTVNARQKA